jgi:hypothetical protein
MATILRSWRLANGLTVVAEDDSVNYYGDYHNIRLTIRCPVTVKPEYLAPLKENPHYDKALALLGPVTEYRRDIVKAGVPGKDLTAVREHLLQKFEETALPYFEREVFSERLVQKRFAEVAKEVSKGNRFDGRNGD